jgi:hypothetical protein
VQASPHLDVRVAVPCAGDDLGRKQMWDSSKQANI